MSNYIEGFAYDQFIQVWNMTEAWRAMLGTRARDNRTLSTGTKANCFFNPECDELFCMNSSIENLRVCPNYTNLPGFDSDLRGFHNLRNIDMDEVINLIPDVEECIRRRKREMKCFKNALPSALRILYRYYEKEYGNLTVWQFEDIDSQMHTRMINQENRLEDRAFRIYHEFLTHYNLIANLEDWLIYAIEAVDNMLVEMVSGYETPEDIEDEELFNYP